MDMILSQMEQATLPTTSPAISQLQTPERGSNQSSNNFLLGIQILYAEAVIL